MVLKRGNVVDVSPQEGLKDFLNCIVEKGKLKGPISPDRF